MKKLFLTLVLVSGFARADYWTVPSTQGGLITLTQEVWAKNTNYEKCRGQSIAFITFKDQQTQYGCWVSSGGKIHVFYFDGIQMSYSQDGWTFNAETK